MTSRFVPGLRPGALLVLLFALPPTACEPSLRCGDGTIEQDGACVPATDGPVCYECGSGPACHNGFAADGSCECDDGHVPVDPNNPSNLACVLPDSGAEGEGGIVTGADDDDGDDDGGVVDDGGVDDDGGADDDGASDDGASEQPYAACPSGSDAECLSDETCAWAIGSCASWCTEDQDCPDPAEGTAVQICADIDELGNSGCVLSCAAADASCPAGMTCDDDPDALTYLLCVR